MLRATTQYARDEVFPRLPRIVFSAHVFVAVAICWTVYTHGPYGAIAATKTMDLISSTFAYGSIVFGSSIAGMALVLTFPNETFVTLLMNKELPGRKDSAYSALLFVFSWTAVLHWMLLVLSVVLWVVRGSEAKLLNEFDGKEYRILVGVFAGTAVYAIGQFLLTVITLVQVGRMSESCRNTNPNFAILLHHSRAELALKVERRSLG